MKGPRFTKSIRLSRLRHFNSKRTKNVHLSTYFHLPKRLKEIKLKKLLFLYLETFITFVASNKNFNYEIF
jgi:hypothetical protein